VLQAAWAMLLSRLTNSTDVVYGMVTSGRHAPVPGIEQMLGLVITTTPVRARFQPDEPTIAFMQRLQREQAALLPHHHLSLAEIHQLLDAEPLFDTLFTYQNYPVDHIEPARTAEHLPLTAIHGDNSNHYPLSLAALPGPQLGLRIHYDANVFRSAEAETVAARLHRLLERIAQAPLTVVSRIDVLTAEERLRFLDAGVLNSSWGKPLPSVTARSLCAYSVSVTEPRPEGVVTSAAVHTAAAAPTETFVDLFEKEAAMAAGRIAVVSGEEAWTYAEIEARANRLAWRLIMAGIGPEDRVALHLERRSGSRCAWHVESGGGFCPARQ
jgi:non-ribosomal peptide synthetase component F